MPEEPEPALPRGLRSRWKAGPFVLGLLLAFAALVIGSLFSRVCVPIPDRELPAFESVMSMEERAAQGEPFEKKGNHWYQCKSRLARAFFF
jgi:hypothetical protein